MLRAGPCLAVPLRELRFQFSRSSGAGGQNVAKVSTRATLRWDVMRSPSLPEDVRRRLLEAQHRRVSRAGVLVISSQRFRDQGRNVADCLEKLRAMLQEAGVRPRTRRPGRPTRASVEKRLREKRRRAETKRRRRARLED